MTCIGLYIVHNLQYVDDCCYVGVFINQNEIACICLKDDYNLVLNVYYKTEYILDNNLIWTY